MLPPPSAVMQPSRQTPTQSMLRRPAASAAVIACAASATSDSAVRTISLDGKSRIATSWMMRELTSQVPGRTEEDSGNLTGSQPLSYDEWANGGPHMANERIPNDPYRDPGYEADKRSPAELDNDLQPDLELA